MRFLLLPASWLYGLLVAVRNLGFDLGLLRQVDAGVPVISVGNLTAGGTGKTPLVEHILTLLLAQGRRPAVVSRGYGRMTRGVVIVSSTGTVLADARAGGDEPVQIARKFPGVRVVVDERRVRAAETAVRECGADVIVMDDGFQHRYLKRDVDIVVLDARTDIRNEPILPAGRRREWCAGLRRASLVAFSRAEAEGPPHWSGAVRRWFRRDMIAFRSRISGFRSATGGNAAAVSGPVFAFSGIGDHDAFIAGLTESGIRIAGHLRFGDHHEYSRREISDICRRAEASSASTLVTTEKDMVRLAADASAMACVQNGPPLVYATIEVVIVSGSDALGRVVDACL